MSIHITAMERHSSTGVVYKVGYEVTQDVDGIERSVTGNAYFEAKPSDSGFISYNDLTELKVAEWVVEYINNQQVVNGLKCGWQALIDSLHSQSVQSESGMPWVNQE